MSIQYIVEYKGKDIGNLPPLYTDDTIDTVKRKIIMAMNGDVPYDSIYLYGVKEMEFTPEESHQAFPGMINGGIIGTLLDCHGNWTAAIALMDKAGDTEPPCTVTASYSIKLRRPTPLGSTLIVKGEVTEIGDDRANVKMSLSADGEVCATGTGLFVAVKEGHPAFHRWS